KPTGCPHANPSQTGAQSPNAPPASDQATPGTGGWNIRKQSAHVNAIATIWVHLSHASAVSKSARAYGTVSRTATGGCGLIGVIRSGSCTMPYRVYISPNGP